MSVSLEELCDHLERFRYRLGSEAVVQQGIAGALATLGVRVEREAILARHSRVDFWLPDEGFGVEVKVRAAALETLRQLHRYACLERVRGLVLVTASLRLGRAIPAHIAAKPTRVVALSSSIW